MAEIRQGQALQAFQCKRCRSIVSNSLHAIGNLDAYLLSSVSNVRGVNVEQGYHDLQCNVCKGIVGWYNKDGKKQYQLYDRKVISVPLVGTLYNEELQQKVAQLESTVAEQHTRIIELGIQTLQNRFDLIHLETLIEQLHPDVITTDEHASATSNANAIQDTETLGHEQ